MPQNVYSRKYDTYAQWNITQQQKEKLMPFVVTGMKLEGSSLSVVEKEKCQMWNPQKPNRGPDKAKL